MLQFPMLGTTMSSQHSQISPTDEAAPRVQTLSQLQAAYMTALILENEGLKQNEATNAALVDTLTKNLDTVTQAVTRSLTISNQILHEICDADGFKPIDPNHAATMFPMPISVENGAYNYWLQRLAQMQDENIIPVEHAEHTPTKSRQPRHCMCCGQAHADSRTCGKSHTCLANTCTA
jgi:hypothetical protein